MLLTAALCSLAASIILPLQLLIADILTTFTRVICSLIWLSPPTAVKSAVGKRHEKIEFVSARAEMRPSGPRTMRLYCNSIGDRGYGIKANCFSMRSELRRAGQRTNSNACKSAVCYKSTSTTKQDGAKNRPMRAR